LYHQSMCLGFGLWPELDDKIWNMVFAEKLRQAEEHLAAHDKKLANIIKTFGHCQLRPHSDHYAELVSGIVGQQLSVKAAATIWQRVLLLNDGNLPTPEQLLKLKDEDLRASGVSYPKIRYMKDLAEHILDGRLDMTHITTLPNYELIEQLTAVKGIGEWSAHMFMIFGLGRLDILPFGDLGIRKAAMNIYNLPALPMREDLEKIAKKNNWHPYQSVAAWYLWESFDNKPAETRHPNT
jgi:DNA-3-methyladenine glycosylase II